MFITFYKFYATAKVQDKREEEYKNSIIAEYFKDERLINIPVQYMKRKIVLNKVKDGFNLNQKYTEREVNIILADYYDDFVSLRKALVKEEFLSCYDKLYTRNNGNKFFEKGRENMVNNNITNLPLLIDDSLIQGEKIIYELNKDDGVFKISGISNKDGDVDRIVFSNKGRIFVFKVRKNDTLAALAIYSYSLYKQKLGCEKIENSYICEGKKVKCNLRSGFSPVGIMDINFKLKEEDFLALANSFEEKLFAVK
ncbi:MAG: DUF2087 domain-containing protein [Clostridium sp.]